MHQKIVANSLHLLSQATVDDALVGCSRLLLFAHAGWRPSLLCPLGTRTIDVFLECTSKGATDFPNIFVESLDSHWTTNMYICIYICDYTYIWIVCIFKGVSGIYYWFGGCNLVQCLVSGHNYYFSESGHRKNPFGWDIISQFQLTEGTVWWWCGWATATCAKKAEVYRQIAPCAIGNIQKPFLVGKMQFKCLKRICWDVKYMGGGNDDFVTLPKTNIAPENRPSQKDTSIPAIRF